jgi:hypothetical protein
LFKYLGKWLHLDRQRKSMFFEAYLYRGVARFQVLTRPVKRIAKKLGAAGEPVTDPALIRQVAWAIRTAARVTPWKSNLYGSNEGR